MNKVPLPSGATLTIDLPKFEVSLNLYQVLMRELQGIEIRPNNLDSVLFKDYLAGCLSSKEVQDAMWECFKRCLYNSGKPGAGDLAISWETFEPVEDRANYIKVCMEVVKENTDPFVRGLFAEFPTLHALMLLLSTPESKSPTTPS